LADDDGDQKEQKELSPRMLEVLTEIFQRLVFLEEAPCRLPMLLEVNLRGLPMFRRLEADLMQIFSSRGKGAEAAKPRQLPTVDLRTRPRMAEPVASPPKSRRITATGKVVKPA